MRLPIFFAFLILSSCSMPPQEEVNEVSQSKETFLKTKNVSTIDINADELNPATLDFYLNYPGQLVELTFKTSKFSTILYTLNNNNASYGDKNRPALTFHDLEIELNGANITSCLIAECNSTKCTGSQANLTSFSGTFSTEKLYLNLTKLDKSGSPDCSSVVMNEGSNRLVFKENYSGPLGKKTGGRISAQAIVYNRTYDIADIQNMFAN